MPTARSILGRRAEELATEELVRRGCEILDTNYRCRYGEVDVIARDGDSLVFVEVRSRRSNDPAFPAESIDEKKQARLVLAAQHYLSSHESFTGANCRFDVIEVRFQRGRPVAVDVIQDAFRER